MKEKDGIKIKVSADKLTISAVTQKGVLALNTWVKSDYSVKTIRIKYNVEEKEWPLFTIKQMYNGDIYMIIFSKKEREDIC